MDEQSSRTSRTETLIKAIGQAIGCMEEKLEPVLMPAPKEKAERVTEGTALNSKLAGILDRLDELRARIEL